MSSQAPQPAVVPVSYLPKDWIEVSMDKGNVAVRVSWIGWVFRGPNENTSLAFVANYGRCDMNESYESLLSRIKAASV